MMFAVDFFMDVLYQVDEVPFYLSLLRVLIMNESWNLPNIFSESSCYRHLSLILERYSWTRQPPEPVGEGYSQPLSVSSPTNEIEARCMTFVHWAGGLGPSA